MNRNVNTIAGALSLRAPQRRSLEILHRVTELAKPGRDLDVASALQVIQSEFPSVTDFERPFVNLCFALATGVGKTRLMGAFISYLFHEHGVRHFLVLAPNLTIYRKLIADFTPNTPKYVFEGIAEFAIQPPTIITGDNWESGVGVRNEARKGQQKLGFVNEPVHINIFNSAKFVAKGEAKEIRKLRSVRETIGESYFDYLAGLDDLVIIMDEAHRYRAAGAMDAIVDLKPILGIELTATPQIEQGGKKQAKRFDNIIYDYALAQAMRDGFVKQPAVATKEGMLAADAKKMADTTLDWLKLEDGVRVHETTKVELDTFARNTGRPLVKPFMLVIAKDTTHSAELLEHMRSPAFFDGRYADKVMEIHSGQSGSEKDENVELLLGVERVDNPIEIVVHVNMLKEGWDVTNLYTIVPLRTADSKTLVEQSIGRGLRLPYGRRTGVEPVDRLTIIAHERFDEIIEAAKANGFSFSQVVIPQAAAAKVTTVTSESKVGAAIANSGYKTSGEQLVATTTVKVIAEEGHSFCTRHGLPATPESLKAPAVQSDIQKAVGARVEAARSVAPAQGELPYTTVAPARTASIVADTTTKYIAYTVNVPRIVVVPKEGHTVGFQPFTVDVSSMHFAAISDKIVIQHLTSEREGGATFKQFTVGGSLGGLEEQRLSDYIVRGLMDAPEVSYDLHADFLYGIAEQVVTHLRTYLSEEEAGRVLQVYQQQIVANLRAQMEAHRWEDATEYEAKVTQGFMSAQPESYTVKLGVEAVDFRKPVANKQGIKNMLFGGFDRGFFDLAKFDSDTERRLAVILDRDATVQAWVKPAKGTLRIFYSKDERYEPDFVVQTATEKFLLESKAKDQMTDPVVLKKAKAAVEWCKYATEHEAQSEGGRPWRYALIPHDAVTESMTLSTLVNTFGSKA